MVSTNPLVLIGPGSEWFWSMLQLVVVAVSLLGLYRQVRLQTSASAIEQADALSREWASERLNRSRFAVLRYVRDNQDWVNVPVQPSNVIGDFWERVAYLVRKGHVQRDIVSAYLGSAVELWWVILGPYARQLRQSQNDAAIYEHFEWLAGIMAEMDRRAGQAAGFDQTTLTQRIAYSLQVSGAAIRAAEELRAVPPLSPTAPDIPLRTEPTSGDFAHAD